MRKKKIKQLTLNPIPPVRLCCGEHHKGAMCPDGLIMCCVCFERVSVAELYIEENGDVIDMCKPCGNTAI